MNQDIFKIPNNRKHGEELIDEELSKNEKVFTAEIPSSIKNGEIKFIFADCCERLYSLSCFIQRL